MNLKYLYKYLYEKIKRLFNTKDSSKLSLAKQESGIVNIEMLTTIPKREDLQQPMLVDNYKEYFMNIVKQDQTLLTSYFNREELTFKINLYIKTLIELTSSEELETYSLIKLKKEEFNKKEVELKIITLKLSHYLEEIKKIQKDLNYSLAALGEILVELHDTKNKYKKRIFFLNEQRDKKGRNLDEKIGALNKVLNQLLSLKIITDNQLQAAILTKNSTSSKITALIEMMGLKGYKSDQSKIEEIILDKLQTNDKYLNILSITLSDDLEPILRLVVGEIAIAWKYLMYTEYYTNYEPSHISNTKETAYIIPEGLLAIDVTDLIESKKMYNHIVSIKLLKQLREKTNNRNILCPALFKRYVEVSLLPIKYLIERLTHSETYI